MRMIPRPTETQLKQITYMRFPYLSKLPYEPKEIRGYPRIEASVKIFNHGWLTQNLLTNRADDCQAVLYFKKQGDDVIFQKDCIWQKSEEKSATIPTGLLPQLLRIFVIDTVRHEILVDTKTDPRGISHTFATVGKYDLTLLIDYQGGKSTTIKLGEVDIPGDLLSETNSFEIWRKSVGYSGYAIFPETTVEGKRIAKFVGKIPDNRLDELKKDDDMLKHFEFLAV
jgi:hypothetical protein